jgi:Methyltransferase domain
MLASLPPEQIVGASVLDIGGGVGAMQAELLGAGAARGVVVELVAAYEPFARSLARERGIEDRTTFRVADLLEEPDAAASAEVVVLNRVVCCSPDGVALTGVAARLAQRSLVLSFPRDRPLVRLGLRAINGLQWAMGRSFRVFCHRPASLFAAAQNEGLRLVEQGHGRLWEYAWLGRT